VTDWVALVAALFAAPPSLPASDCIPIHEASQHVGETKCVSGMVVRVKVGVKGRALPRLLRGSDGLPVYSSHLSSRPERCRRRPRLAGRMIETHGRVKLYDRRADHSQPHQPDHWRSLPDSSHPQELRPREPWPLQRRPPASQQKPKKTKAKPNTTQTFGNDVEGQEPPE
jgi:hypothetical protein